MRIRFKIILVVLPLLIVTLFLAEAASYITAANGITRITQQFFNFKINEVQKYVRNQWVLLVENNYAERQDMVMAAQNALGIYARSIILNDTEIIFAVDPEGKIPMATSPLEIRPEEREVLLDILHEEHEGIMYAVIDGKERVFKAFYFTPFRWYILLSEEKAVFYQDLNEITTQTIVIIAGTSLAAMIVLICFAGFLTKPLRRIVKTMHTVISSGDLSSRVEVEYQDETGNLAHTFNLMIGELERVYKQIKQYAFDAMLAQKKEQRIRHIFQKYVPKDLIDKFFAAPESMLAGENRELAILFSDIRGFTGISERMAPDELVHSLNRYFSDQVDIIMNRNGIVDKYIGDAIMAFWGAPVRHEDDAMQAVLAGLDMIEVLKQFNEQQRELGKPEFHIGIGIGYGTVTVGNIGSERKMDYTVIGDVVNLASRLEGLTKTYQEELLISESLYSQIKHKEPRLPIRLLDTVAVKGKAQGVKIYAVKRSITVPEAKAWGYYHEGMSLYYRRSFEDAAQQFKKALIILHEDYSAETLIARCLAYADNPPPPEWNGVEVMRTK
ncbi:MAG: HAMP domain-containing protein [Treponema sp.]|jgi:class 3 adenylate cyclase/HAMP domain-containing protein|nr:HAMP domain-containing protein [Treponema sp.]